MTSRGAAERTWRVAAVWLWVRCAWILWVGTAAAMQSADYGNMGPVGAWQKRDSFEDMLLCREGLKFAVDEHVRANPGAVKRREDLVVEQKQVGGDEEMVVHSVTRFACLPDTVEPPPLDGSKSAAEASPPGADAAQPEPGVGQPAPGTANPTPDAAPGTRPSTPPSADH